MEGKPQAATAAGPVGSLVADYSPRPGTADEMMGPDGKIRPAWRPLIDRLDRLTRAEIDAQFARADRYLRDAGVFYQAYGDGGSNAREWPLAHVPVLIEEAEWRTIAAGLVQRAELLEQLVADIYGDNRLVSEGLLPPQLIAASPEYLRPMAGWPAGKHFLHFLAFELGRGPDGRWWVLGDRTQAPSGAGFALENRVATGRALADLLATMNVHRLAGFFRDLRDALFELAGPSGGGVAVLTPGQLNETYFEHAYIARYLGLMLLEGGDLTIADGKVMVRTVEGPKALSVLWRRLDSAFLDPLELKPESRIGTPGLADAIRRGAATVVDAIGSGILETRALLAFLPGISRKLNGEDLALPNIATWWCGQDRERTHVLQNLERMMIGPALATSLPLDDGEGTLLPSSLDRRSRAALAERLRTSGEHYAAQESVTLSTMPVYADGKLQPRPVTLRAFAARTRSGWSIMPGGFARVGASTDTSAISMQKGGRAADVWILSSAPVEQITLLPADDDGLDAKLATVLPSRAADNLFWLGRYIERADGLARVLRAYHGRIAEDPQARNPVLPAIRLALKGIGIDARRAIPGALTAHIDAAADNAGRIRDRFSADGWLALMDLSKTVHRFATTVTPGDDASRAMTVLLRKLAGFAGLAYENMYHGTGWRFLEIGRRLERALEMSRLTALFAKPGATAELLDLLVEIGDSVMTRRRRYKVNSGRLAAIELLALDEANPRSIAFQLAQLKSEIALLPGRGHGAHIHPVMREALRLHTELAISEPNDVSPDSLKAMAGAIAGLSDLIDTAYFR
jgi:uncharacterized circularly permuted ATP-grasp superfamily protein/uncharacterized alpha-E superfamily protein